MSYTDENQKGAVTAPAMLRRIVEVLYPDDSEPHIRFAHRLGVQVRVVKSWLLGQTKSLTKEHSVFGDLEELLRQREQELKQVRIALHEWRTNVA